MGQDVSHVKGLVTDIIAVSKKMKVPFGLMKMMCSNLSLKSVIVFHYVLLSLFQKAVK